MKNCAKQTHGTTDFVNRVIEETTAHRANVGQRYYARPHRGSRLPARVLHHFF